MRSCMLLVILCAVLIGFTNGQLLNSRFNARKEASERLLASTTNLANNRLGLSQSQYGLGNALNGVSPLSAMNMSPMGGRLGKKSPMMSPYSTGLGLGSYNGLTGYGGLNALGGMGNLGSLGGIGSFGMLGGMNSMSGLLTPEIKPKGTVYNLRNPEEDEQIFRANAKRMSQGKAGKKKSQRLRMKPLEEEILEDVEDDTAEVYEEQPQARKQARGKKQQNRTRKLSKKNQKGRGKNNQVIDAITLNQNELDGFIDAKKKNAEKPIQDADNGQIKKLSARRPANRQGRLE